MSPARAEVWCSNSAQEGGGSFLGATIRQKPGQQAEEADEFVHVDVMYDGDEWGECGPVL